MREIPLVRCRGLHRIALRLVLADDLLIWIRLRPRLHDALGDLDRLIACAVAPQEQRFLLLDLRCVRIAGLRTRDELEPALRILEDDEDRSTFAVGLRRDLTRSLRDRAVVGARRLLPVTLFEVLVAVAKIVLGLGMRCTLDEHDRRCRRQCERNEQGLHARHQCILPTTMVMSSLRLVSPKYAFASPMIASRISPASSAAALRTEARNRFSPYSSPAWFSHSTMPSVYQTKTSPIARSVVLASYFDVGSSPSRLPRIINEPNSPLPSP